MIKAMTYAGALIAAAVVASITTQVTAQQRPAEVPAPPQASKVQTLKVDVDLTLVTATVLETTRAYVL